MMLGRFHMVAYVGSGPIGRLDADVRPATTELLEKAIERDLVVAPATVHERMDAGDVALVSVTDSTVGGIIWICPTAHRDEHFGLASRPSQLGVYAHQLLVHADARGNGIGQALLLATRHYAVATFDRQVHTLVDPANHASAKAHERTGYTAAGAVRGIRVGPLTLRSPRPPLPLTPVGEEGDRAPIARAEPSRARR